MPPCPCSFVSAVEMECCTGGHRESEAVTGKKRLGDSWEHTLTDSGK
jgi:hypothetical protein